MAVFGVVVGAAIATAVLVGADGPRAASDQPPTTGTPPDEPNTTSGGEPAPAVPVEVAGGSLVVWARGGLDDTALATANALDDVVAAAFVRSDTLGLVGSRNADGEPVDEFPDGYRVPVFVAAIDPVAYADTLSDAHAPVDVRAPLAALAPGEVVLSETAAELRRLGPGASLEFAGAPPLVVAAVLPDGVVRRAEVIAHTADAEALGLPPHGSLVVRHRAHPQDVPTLATTLESLGTDERPVRVSGAGVTDGRHTAPLVLSLGEIKARFGEFAYRPRPRGREIDVDPAWVAEHIVDAEVPVLGTVRCHGAIIDDLRAAIDEIVAAGLEEHLAPRRYGGCHYPRTIRTDTDRLSSHSWGIAIDINVDLDLPGLGPVPPEEFIDIFGRHGFRWGGDFTEPDNHHFEWIGQAATERP